MNLPLSLLLVAIAGGISPAALAGQRSGTLEIVEGQKARPDPVAHDAAYSVCKAMVPVSHEDFSLANGVGPSSVVLGYFMSRGEAYDIKSWKKTLVESPKHGELILQPTGGYFYYPNDGYLGPDQLTWVVEAQGKKFKVIETVWVANVAPEYGGCPADYRLPPATTGNNDK